MAQSFVECVQCQAGRMTNQVKIYCVWLLRKLTSAGRPMGMPLASQSHAVMRSGAGGIRVSICACICFGKQWLWTHTLFARSTLLGCLYARPFGRRLESTTRLCRVYCPE